MEWFRSIVLFCRHIPDPPPDPYNFPGSLDLRIVFARIRILVKVRSRSGSVTNLLRSWIRIRIKLHGSATLHIVMTHHYRTQFNVMICGCGGVISELVRMVKSHQDQYESNNSALDAKLAEYQSKGICLLSLQSNYRFCLFCLNNLPSCRRR